MDFESQLLIFTRCVVLGKSHSFSWILSIFPIEVRDFSGHFTEVLLELNEITHVKALISYIESALLMTIWLSRLFLEPESSEKKFPRFFPCIYLGVHSLFNCELDLSECLKYPEKGRVAWSEGGAPSCTPNDSTGIHKYELRVWSGGWAVLAEPGVRENVIGQKTKIEGTCVGHVDCQPCWR